jgi:putative addiction module antidote
MNAHSKSEVTLKVVQVGNSLGVILPKDALAKLKVEKGDQLFITETPDGYRLTPYSDKFARQMEVARHVMKKYRNVLRELAK